MTGDHAHNLTNVWGWGGFPAVESGRLLSDDPPGAGLVLIADPDMGAMTQLPVLRSGR